jgi:hypothetical protein
MKRIQCRSVRRRIVAGAIFTALTAYTAGYLLSCHVSWANGSGRLARRYHWKWEMMAYAPAAKVEAAARGLDVWIGPRDSNHGTWHFPFGVQRPTAAMRLLPLPPDFKRKPLSPQNIEVIEGKKILKVPVVHSGGNAANYSIQLKCDALSISQTDGVAGFYVMWGNPIYVPGTHPGQIDVHRRVDGGPAWHQVRFAKAKYLDLNGDGVFDALVDYRLERDYRLFIMLDDRVVEVKHQGRGPGVGTMRTAQSPAGNAYIFSDLGAWQLADRSVRAYPVEYSAEPTAPRELGPEWTKFSIPNTQMIQYRRELKVPIDRLAEDATSYTVELERDQVRIGEVDGNRGFFVRWDGNSRVDVRRSRDRASAWHRVEFPTATYLDLNGDGIFDLFADLRQDRAEGQLSILFNHRFILVKAAVEDLSEAMRTAETAEGITYVFEGDTWRVNP